MATKRLLQLLEEHTALSSLSPDIQRPSLDNILSVTAVDLETQDHILNYHVPAAITRCNIGLVVIDSITANYRAESSTGNVDGLLERAWELKKLGRLLRNLAAKHNIAIVVANQISDRLSNGSSWLGDLECLSSPFGERPKAQLSSQQLHLSPQLPSSLASYPPIPGTAPSSSMYPTQANITQSSTPLPSIYDRRIPSGTLQINIRSIHSVLTFAYQQPFYTGWGDPYDSKSCKTPALGQVWTNELGCRIVLKIHDTKEMNDISAILKSTAHHFNASSEAKGEATHRLSIDAVTQEEEQGVRRDEVKNEKEARKEMQHQNQPLARCHDQAKYIPVSRPDTISRPTFRRKRTVEVVFSPWTSGNSSSKSENNQNMPTQYNMVEVEILPSGLRGIPTC